MLAQLKFALQIRLAVILILLHAGLTAALIGLWKVSPLSAQLPEGALVWLSVGVASLYGSFLVMVLFVLVPAWPWIQRARRLREWQTWVFEILPQIMAAMPIILAGIKTVKAAWEEFQESGDWTTLDPDQVAKRVKHAAKDGHHGAKRTHKRSEE